MHRSCDIAFCVALVPRSRSKVRVFAMVYHRLQSSLILNSSPRVMKFKETRSVTMNIFRKKYFLFKSFVKTELSYIFTINKVSTAENCKESELSY